MKIIFKNMLLIYCLLLTVYSCNNEEVFEEQTIIPEEEEEIESPEDAGANVLLGNDSYTTNENTSVILGTYENDENIPNNPIVTFTDPSNGVLTIDDNDTPNNLTDDSITYTPNPDYSGTDSFEYTICDSTDSENCDTGTVEIVINPVVTDDVDGELKAFPSAYGAGAYTTGGRGKSVYHVTNLNDSGAGSFRDAVSSDDRTIVFDVSGVINLTSRLFCSSKNLTIAGQTAPEGGITIAGSDTYWSDVDNLIVRHIRFKGGVHASTESDSFTMVHSITNIIFDHCSFAFGSDESASWYENNGDYTLTNITIQRCLFAESKTGTIIGGGGTTTTGDVSVINNMWYNIQHRFPNAWGTNANFDVINNVVWTVHNRLAQANGENIAFNHIGNYYDFGNREVNDFRLNMSENYSSNHPQIYTSGNKYVVQGSGGNTWTRTIAGLNSNNQTAWSYFANSDRYGDQLPQDYFTNTQHPLVGAEFTVKTADQAFADVKSNVGCNSRLNANGSIMDNTDTLDAGWLANVDNGSYVPKSSINTSSMQIPNITSVSRPEDYDTDRDGMPDVWEVAKGFNPNSNDSAEDADGDGYTNLEEFLNLVDI